MKNPSFVLESLGACHEALDWADQFKSAQQAWTECKRGDWMIWYLQEMSNPINTQNHKKLMTINRIRYKLRALKPLDRGLYAGMHTYESHPADKMEDLLSQCADNIRKVVPKPPLP